MEEKSKLLLIDDNENDLQLVRHLLERNGYAVETASTGREGLDVLESVDPQCVLVDYRMPGMNGYQVARSIKAEERFRNVPVLILTGADSTHQIVEGLDSGADDFVTKSSDVEVILARVRALLRIKVYQDRIVRQSEELRDLYDEVKEKSDRIMQLNERMNRDLEFARRVQESLLPNRELDLPGIRIASEYLPTETLSGDFYDYFESGGKGLMFFADVSGHGVPAAILTSLLKSFLHTEAPEMSSLGDFMGELNKFLFSASLPSQYATALFTSYNPEQKVLSLTTAAHPPAVLFRRTTGEAELLEHPGHLLGAMPDSHFEEHHVEVSEGDTFIAYSDGLTDRIDSEGEFYSVERIKRLAREGSEKSLPELRQSIIEDTSSFNQTSALADDTAFVLMRFC